ncbi:hypothetical protein IV500_15240 [Paeniglutamicibacter antarcticus]|uniref:DUF4352 domain-containing protein n=1 Tax=Arthrobacter terrae TaxID=2935737 RepID=A0A931G671_9MICC|nr:hypothetical protein [Arthrobacter terrae]MBG0740728.1 hypothetical protein [Arthrobacter terrae]
MHVKKSWVALSLAAVTLTSCSPGRTLDETAGGPSTVAAVTASPGQTVTFGQWISYGKGIKVTVRTDGFQTVSPYAEGSTGSSAAVFEIDVSNASTADFDPAQMSKLSVTYGAEDTKASQVIDAPAGATTGPLGPIGPGKSETIRLTFAIPPGTRTNVHVQVPGPTAGDPPAVFTGFIE